MVKIRDYHPVLEDGSIDLEHWQSRVSAFRKPKEIELISNTVELAEQYSEECLTAFGESCFQQGLMMADILHDLGLDAETVSAALVSEVRRYSKLTDSEIEKNL